jgi:1,4-dihydroxy-2-naphthoate octaprenyltransferase
MQPAGMLRRVSLLRTDISEERTASINRVTRIGELGTTIALTSYQKLYYDIVACSVLRLLVGANVVPTSSTLVTLMMEIVPLKRRLLQEPHGVTFHKTAFFIVTAMETSNLT